MGLNENILLPSQETEGPACGTDLLESVNRFLEESGRSLPQDDIAHILTELRDDLGECHNDTLAELTLLNTQMFEQGINIVRQGAGEERFLKEIGIQDSSELFAQLEDFPNEYSIRVSGSTIVISDSQGNPILNYDKTTQEYSLPGFTTWRDNIEDNVDAFGYELTEFLLNKQISEESVQALQETLFSDGVRISGIGQFSVSENVAAIIGIETHLFSNILSDFQYRTQLNLTNYTPLIKITSGGNLQLITNENSKTQIYNYSFNGDFTSQFEY